jgi:prephenate dehydrogenase
MDNPAAAEFSERYLEAARRLLEIFRSKDKQAFADLFLSLRETFEPGDK